MVCCSSLVFSVYSLLYSVLGRVFGVWGLGFGVCFLKYFIVIIILGSVYAVLGFSEYRPSILTPHSEAQNPVPGPTHGENKANL